MGGEFVEESVIPARAGRAAGAERICSTPSIGAAKADAISDT